MLSKSKLKKLKGQFEKLCVSQDELVKEVGTNKVTLGKIYKGETYDGELVKRLVAARDKRLAEVKELEAAI